MLQRFFPRQIDNSYRGHVLAIWLFIPVVAVKTLMGFNAAGLNPLISSSFVLQGADGVPVDSYPADVASHLVFLFAAWGLALFVLTLVAWVVLIRYRAMLPLIIVALLVEQVGRMLLSRAMLSAPGPSQEGVSTGALINLGLVAFLAVALFLSMLPRRPQLEQSGS